jgi:hypothetical protein
LGPHPADPMAVHDGSQVEDEHLEGPNMMEERAIGTDIYVHSGRGGYASVPACLDYDLAEYLRVSRYCQHIHLLEIPHTDSACRT